MSAKYSLQHRLRTDNEYLKAQLKAYQVIVAECLAAAWGLDEEKAKDLIPPPVEIGVDYSDLNIQLAINKWWAKMTSTYHSGPRRCARCGARFRECWTCGEPFEEALQ